MKTIDIAASPIFQYLPSGWAYNAAVAAARGNLFGSIPFLLILAVCSTLLGWVALILTARHYAGGVVEEVAPPKVAAPISFGLGGSPLAAHIKRDVILFSRETGVVAQSLLMLIILLLFPFVVKGETLQRLTVLGISPVGTIIAALFGGQLASRLLAIERLGFWRNLVFPSGRHQTLTSKFILGLGFVTVLSALAATVHAVVLQQGNLGGVFLIVFFSWIGFAVGIMAGAFWSNFNWDHPRRMLKSGGGLIFAFAIIVIGPAMYALTYGISRLLADFVNPTMIVLVFSLGFLSISYIVSAIRLLNMEWTPDV
jgi:hypothetical protein